MDKGVNAMESRDDVLEVLGSILDDEQGKLKLSNAQSYEDIYKLYKDYEGKLNINDFKQEFDKFVCSRINKAGLSEDNLQTVSGGKGSKVTSALMAGLATISSAGMGASAGHFVSSPTSSKQIIEKSKSFVKTHPWITTSVGVGVPTTLGLGTLALYLFTHSEKEPGPSPGDGGSGGNGGNNPGYKKDEYNEKFWSNRSDDEDKDLTYTKGNHYRAFHKDYDISSFTLSADSEENAIIEYFKGHEAAAKRLSFAELNIVEFKAQGGVQDGKLAIVNAANANLGDGSGCCADVYRADQFAEEEASKWKHETGLNGLNTGDAMIQRATGLRGNGISYIIQALGPDLRDKSLLDENKKQLVSAYVNSVELAAAHGCTAVAFPSISTGIFKYPENEASPLAVRAVIQALEQANAQNLKVCLSTYKINGGDSSSVLAKFAKAHEQFMKSLDENPLGGSGEGDVTKNESEDQNSEDSKDSDESSDDVYPIDRSSGPSPASSPDLPSEEPPKDETIPVQAAPVAEPQVVEEPIVEEPHQENEQDSGIAAPTTGIQAPVVNAAPPEVAQPVVQKNQPSVEKPNPTSTASKPPQSSSSSAGAAASRTSTESSKKKKQAPEPPLTKPQSGSPESEINATNSDKAQKHGFSLPWSWSPFKSHLSTNKSTSDQKKQKKGDDKKTSRTSPASSKSDKNKK